MRTDNATAYAILGLLHHEPLSGYDIKRRVETRISYFWDVGYGQIYPALKKMADEGLVTFRTEKGDRRPDRKVYTITEEGRKALHLWLGQPTTKEYVRYEVLLKVFFGSLVGADRTGETVAEFRKRYAGQAELFAGIAEELRRSLAAHPDHLYYLLTALLGLKTCRAYVEWADEALALLGARPGESEGVK